MELLNIHNTGRKIYLFLRDKEGKQIIKEDKTFYPYFYEKDDSGKFLSYDGLRLKKVFAPRPSDVPEMRTNTSYSSDILYTKRYMIDRVDKIEKTTIKYFFFDIEVLAKELPNPKDAKYPISCITIYNSLYDKTQTWWLKDYKTEEDMLNNFVKYVYTEKPDLLLAWNIDFDFIYCTNRIKDFAKRISPIQETRWNFRNEISYPAGISILDYLGLFKKVFMREPSYALDFVAQRHLNEPSWGQSNFDILTEEIKEKNINDINRMIKLEKKYRLLDYFDEIRRLSKCLWEDLYFNSFIIEMLLLEEAKQKNIVLPNVPQNREEVTFEGATRECLETGALYIIGKYDLTSAYPQMIVNFCLDTQNIGTEGIEINGIKFKQEQTALIPSMVNKILVLKDNLKKQLKDIKDEKSEEYKTTKIKYEAIKGVINSTFGVMGFPSFRLFNNTIASSITYLVRDLLIYTKEEIEKQGYRVIYFDTDSLFIKSEKNLVNELNIIVQEWGLKYGRDGLNIEFEYEGYFEKIFILSKCRYVGDLRTSKGLTKEIKGVEIKKSNSSKYQAFFQDTLIQKILNKEQKETIELWIEQEKDRIKTLPIDEIAIPTKITDKIYKTDYSFKRDGKEIVIKGKIPPIFVRAHNNAKELFGSKFNIKFGELFYYIYVKNMGVDKNNKPITVIGITKHMHFDRSKIDYDEMVRINILTKADMIFDAMGWTKDILQTTKSMQLRLF